MFSSHIIFLIGFLLQDTTVITQNKDTVPHISNVIAEPDSIIPPKKKKKKNDSTQVKTVVFLPDILPQPDPVYFFQNKEKALYFRDISDTSEVISASEVLLDSTREISFDLQQKRKTEKQYWIFFPILAAILLITFVRLNYYKYLSDLRRAFFNLTITQQLFREQELGFTLTSLMLNVNFVLTAGLYLYLLSDYYHLNLPVYKFWLWIFLCLLVAVVYVAKYIFLRLITFFFPITNEVNFYNFNVFLFNKILGIALIFFVLMISFSNPLLTRMAVYVSLAMLFLFFAYRFFRGMEIARNYLGFQKFHFFLYLCTLEIAPAFILIKLIMIWIRA